MKSIEFRLTHPELEPLPTKLAERLRAVLASNEPDTKKTKKVAGITSTQYRLSYETQDSYGQPFRTNGLWHVDSEGWPHTTSIFATSTTARSAAGQLVINQAIEPLIAAKTEKDFDMMARPKSTLFLAMLVLYDKFGVSWLDDLTSATHDPELDSFVSIGEEIDFEHIPPYVAASGYVETMLHQASPRMPGEPRARVYGIQSLFR